MMLRTWLSKLVVVVICGILVGNAHGRSVVGNSSLAIVQTSTKDEEKNNLLRRHRSVSESADRPRKLNPSPSPTQPTGSDFSGLAYSQCNNLLYVIFDDGSGIYQLNVTPPEAQRTGRGPGGLEEAFLASDPSGDGDCPQLYVGDSRGTVFDIDENEVAMVEADTFGADFDCDGDFLWSVQEAGGLFKNNITTDMDENVFVGNTSISTVTGLSFDCCDKRLYAVASDGESYFLYVINTKNGESTLIGGGGPFSANVDSFAIVPADPCPPPVEEKCYVDIDYYYHHDKKDFAMDYLDGGREYHLGDLCSYKGEYVDYDLRRGDVALAGKRPSITVCCELKDTFLGKPTSDVDCAPCEDCKDYQFVNDGCCAYHFWNKNHYDVDGGDSRHLSGIFRGGCIDQYDSYEYKCCKCGDHDYHCTKEDDCESFCLSW